MIRSLFPDGASTSSELAYLTVASFPSRVRTTARPAPGEKSLAPPITAISVTSLPTADAGMTVAESAGKTEPCLATISRPPGTSTALSSHADAASEASSYSTSTACP